MEDILTGAGYAALALAAASLIASVVIFVKADVLDAARFLRHKATRAHPVAASVPKSEEEATPAQEDPSAQPAASVCFEPPTRFLPANDESEDSHA